MLTLETRIFHSDPAIKGLAMVAIHQLQWTFVQIPRLPLSRVSPFFVRRGRQSDAVRRWTPLG